LDPPITDVYQLVQPSIAIDSAGDNDAYVIGDPVWVPTGGMMDGAIQLDGTDDCIIGDSILNPSEGPFSVNQAFLIHTRPGELVSGYIEGHTAVF